MSRLRPHKRVKYTYSDSSSDEYPTTSHQSRTRTRKSTTNSTSPAVASQLGRSSRLEISLPTRTSKVQHKYAVRSATRRRSNSSSADRVQNASSRGSTVMPKGRNRPRPGRPSKSASGGLRELRLSINSHKPSNLVSHHGEQTRARSKHAKSVVPPWQSLPFHILKTILYRASHPIHEGGAPSDTIQWLVRVSMLSKSFHEAALAVLVYSPPLLPAYRAYGLIALLRQDQKELSTSYQPKIKSLEIEVKCLLAGKGGIDISELIRLTPRLTKLRLYHTLDEFTSISWARPVESKTRWTYPDSLFETLDAEQRSLQTFEWNGRFPDPVEVLRVMQRTHLRPCLASLRTLTCVNLSLYGDKTARDAVEEASNLFTSSLISLPYLRHLNLHSSSIVNELTMSHFPDQLRSLKIVNCPHVASTEMETFLDQRGHDLRSLVLVGNQSLSLSFMGNLRSTCPNLEQLTCNLTYIDPSTYNDRDPMYDRLLPYGPPSWPRTLGNIHLLNLRQISFPEAEAFLMSLINAAEELSILRRLTMTMILTDICWRERAEMRKIWLARLEHIFLADWIIPASNRLSTVKPRSSTTFGRQSSRIAENNTKKTEDFMPALNPGAQPLFRQRGCEVVHFMVSDQRPAQEQFQETDFLDDEPDDDHEYRG